MSVKSRVVCAAGLGLVTTVLISTACSSTTENTGTLAVAVAPTSITVAQGGAGNATATITRGAPFTEAAALTATGAPSGMNVTFTPATIAAGATASQVNVAVGATVPAATYPVVIHAAGTGVTTATATLNVVVTSASAGSFSLAAAPASLTAPAGGAAQQSVIAITRNAPFTGAVDFSVDGTLPTGLSTSFSPPTASGASSTLNVTAASTAAAGATTLVVRGKSAGVADATTNVVVTVTGGAAAGVTLALNPANVGVTAGGATVPTTLTVTRTGTFTGPVNIAVTPPSGVTGITATPASATIAAGATTDVITVGAASTVAAGPYNMTVTATGTGITATPITLPVNVSAPSGGGSVNFTFCAEDAPYWVAIQDGSAGTWTRVTPTSGSTYTFNFPSGKGGIATVDTSLTGSTITGTTLSVIYASLADFTAAQGAINLGACRANTMTGTMAGLGATEASLVSIGYGFSFVAANGAFTIDNVASGSQALIATRTDITTGTVNKIIRRPVNVPNVGGLGTVDFGIDGLAPAAGSKVTVQNLLSGDNPFVASIFYGVRGSSLAIIGSIADYNASLPAPEAIATMDPSQIVSGETQFMQASVDNANGTRTAGRFFVNPASVFIPLGPALSNPTVGKASGSPPYVLPTLSLPLQAEYNRFVTADYTATSGTADMSIAATAGYFGSAAPNPWVLNFPDLSGVSGFQTAWGIATGVSFDWDVDAEGGAILFLDSNFPTGTLSQTASRSSSTPVTLRTERSGNATGMLEDRLLQVFRRSNPMR